MRPIAGERKEMRITLQSQVSLPASVLCREIEQEAVLLEPSKGKYFGLDEVGTRLFTLLSELGSVQAVYDLMLEEFDVEAPVLERDLLAFVDQLASHRLLEVHDG